MNATVLGARGFIGRQLVKTLQAGGIQCWLPERGEPEIFKRPLGYVYYCIGLTADFRTRPYDTVDAHVGVLRQVLELADFDRLVYLSSTRVYAGCSVAKEDQALTVAPYRSDDLYNLSKLMGESLALASGRNCRVVRLSNVVGPDMGPTNFLGSLLAEARQLGAIHFQTDLLSEKDYVWIDDAVNGLIAVAEKGQRSIYNIAGGMNVRHEAIADLLAAKGISISVVDHAPLVTFPTISIEKLVSETGFQPMPVMPKLAAWLDSELNSGA